MSKEALSFFAKFIESHSGMIYSEENNFQLQNRLEKIAEYQGFCNIENLYKEARREISPELERLILDYATNNETSFFRDPKVFNALEKIVLEKIKNNQYEIKIWSAASSSGQEALTIAIVINELSKKIGKKINYSILGTDISDRILEKAKGSKYSELEVQRGLSTELLNLYFDKDINENWKAKNNISENIKFEKMNLKDESYPYKDLDIIFCRNVLIYQSVQSKAEILKKLTSRLVMGGHLILGSGESLLGISHDYEYGLIEGAVIYKKNKAL